MSYQVLILDSEGMTVASLTANDDLTYRVTQGDDGRDAERAEARLYLANKINIMDARHALMNGLALRKEGQSVPDHILDPFQRDV